MTATGKTRRKKQLRRSFRENSSALIGRLSSQCLLQRGGQQKLKCRDPKRRKILDDGSSGTGSQLQSVLDFDKANHEQHDKPPWPVMLLHGGSSSGTDYQLQSVLDFDKAEHDKPPSPVDNVEWRKLMKLLPRCGHSYRYHPGKANFIKPQPVPKEKVESDRPDWSYAISALQQYCQNRRAEYHLVRVTESRIFYYANHLVNHFNFEARLQNPDVAKPSMKLFFAEAMVPHGKPHFITCCHLIKRRDNVTEGCILCARPHSSNVIHPISDVLEVDERLTPVEHSRYDEHREMAMSFPGIPPWQLNHRPAVQGYRDIVRSQQERRNLKKIRVRQLFEAVLVDLKNKKGMDLKLVKGVRHCTFKVEDHTFRHLNFEAKLHHGLAPRMYFAELVNHGGADRVTVCCVVDPADKVLEKHGLLCARRFIIQPDVRYMDPKNVIYVDLELAVALKGRLTSGLPSTQPG